MLHAGLLLSLSQSGKGFWKGIGNPANIDRKHKASLIIKVTTLSLLGLHYIFKLYKSTPLVVESQCPTSQTNKIPHKPKQSSLKKTHHKNTPQN